MYMRVRAKFGFDDFGKSDLMPFGVF